MSDDEPISKREEQRLDTRNKILMGATELFIESGIHDVSTNDLAEHVGIAKGTIFHHFENKETLIREVILSAFGAELENLGNMLNQPALTVKQIKEITKNMFHEFMEQPGFIKLLLDYSSSFILTGNANKKAEEKHAELMNKLFEPMVEMIPQVLINFGVPEVKAKTRTYLFMAALDGIGLYLYLDIIPNDHEYVDQLIDEFIELLIKGE